MKCSSYMRCAIQSGLKIRTLFQQNITHLTWVNKQLTAALSIQHGQLWKPDVIADGNPKTAGVCVNHCASFARGQGIRLLECDSAWNIYVKEVHLYACRLCQCEQPSGLINNAPSTCSYIRNISSAEHIMLTPTHIQRGPRIPDLGYK